VIAAEQYSRFRKLDPLILREELIFFFVEHLLCERKKKVGKKNNEKILEI